MPLPLSPPPAFPPSLLRNKKRSVAYELRQRAVAEAKREAALRLRMVALRVSIGLFALAAILSITLIGASAKEPTIRDVHAGQLEKMVATRDFVAVFWYARNCRTCERALEELENIDDDAEKHSVDFVKINDKRLAKSHGVKKFPALTFFQDGEITIYNGDMTNNAKVLEFLTSDAMLVIPNKIEEVNSHSLGNIVAADRHVAALFYESGDRATNLILELENIDDEADEFGIRFVKIRDRELAEEYSLARLPSLVYFRSGIPVVFTGDLSEEEDVLQWLIQHQTSADDEDLIEHVGSKQLDIMISTVDHLLVLYHDEKKLKSRLALEALEKVDDEGDRIGVTFIKVTDSKAASRHGISAADVPALVYYEHEIPHFFAGDAEEPALVLKWLRERVEGADIEAVKGEMLERMIVQEEKIAVLFYKEGEERSSEAVEALEDIDDELDGLGVLFVKNNQPAVAGDYGIEDLPAVVVFEKGVPNLYQGDITESDHVLEWIVDEVSGDDTVEVVTDQMVERLIRKRTQVAVFLYDKDDKKVNKKALDVLDDINDDIEDMPSLDLVKTYDKDVAREYGVKKMPALLFFDAGVPNVYKGDTTDSGAMLEWLSHLAEEDNIEEVNDKMLEALIVDYHDNGGVLVYLYSDAHDRDAGVLRDLETIDDDLEDLDVHMVKHADADGEFARAHNVKELPALVLFSDAHVAETFPGDMYVQHAAVAWVKKLLNLEDDDD